MVLAGLLGRLVFVLASFSGLAWGFQGLKGQEGINISAEAKTGKFGGFLDF